VDPDHFFSASRLVIVAGKGGVGKTTVTASLARAAAREGRRVLIVEVESGSGLAALFGRDRLGYEETDLAPSVRGRTITPDEALVEYLHDHGLSRISRRLVASGALDIVATAAPGIRDILVLGKVKQLERAGAADLIILDAPAAGHAITFLLAARGLLDAVRAGPIATQAREVLELLTNPRRCRVVLVTLAEETPVNEVIDTAFHLEDRVGVALGPVVVNGLYDDLPGLALAPAEAARRAGRRLAPAAAEVLAEAAGFRRDRIALQREQLVRLAGGLPLAQLHLPYLFTADIGADDVDRLAGCLLEGIAKLEPAPR
jgi:MinD-like ATPase involved in chromosome partitioning or flagellar assembly